MLMTGPLCHRGNLLTVRNGLYDDTATERLIHHAAAHPPVSV